MEDRDVREVVRDGYAKIARGEHRQGGCCGSDQPCGTPDVDAAALKFGYSKEDLATVPEGANLGLGCGNPTALASLRPGEVILDLGSGAGIDCLIASRKVGDAGRVIGVDMTPEMLDKARANAAKVGASNVEFRLGEIENLPVADASVDVVISNCVINLSPDKPRVFAEIARVLKPGGRVAVSDMVLLRPLPEAVRNDLLAYVGCVAGAVTVEEYVAGMKAAGLANIEVDATPYADVMIDVQDPTYRRIKDKLPAGASAGDYVASAKVRAIRPIR